jgi:photosystem II stability/assembly factor-like uncharacterized protein
LAHRVVGVFRIALSMMFLAGLSPWGLGIAAAQGPAAGVESKIASAGIVDLHLISPGVGWIVDGQGRLFLTKDNGAVWTDITPHGLSLNGVAGACQIFFLDSTHGWIGAGTWDPDGLTLLLRTQDGGKTWTQLAFVRSAYDELTSAAPSSLQFLDPKHGWFLWRKEGSAAVNFGLLLATSDGGATWTELPEPPSGGPMEFHSLREGSMVAYPQEEDLPGDVLFLTRDGGRTWRKSSVPEPAICKECRRAYQLPSFKNPKRAEMAVTFGAYESPNVDTTYATGDGGKSWQLTDAFKDNDPKGVFASSVETDVVRVFTDAGNGIRIRTGKGATISQSGLPPGRNGRVFGADFIDDSRGWLAYASEICPELRNPATDRPSFGVPGGCGQWSNYLLSTVDGGKTFTVIRPAAAGITK